MSIGAFEHFGFAKYPEFFNKTYDLLPDDGVILPASRAVGSRPPSRGNSPGRAPQFIDGHFAKRQC